MTKILITGKEGQLGKELQLLAKDYNNLKFLFTGREELEITSKNQITAILDRDPVEYIINCAAYTHVDNAETDTATARAVNTLALESLGREAKARGIRIIHISTDYVFSGEKNCPYTEEDTPNPLSAYGDSKLQGEILLRENCPDSIIIRTSWLYSPFRTNFLKTMLKLGREKEELRVVSDQIGTPTYSRDLAETVLEIINSCTTNRQKFIPGIYNYSNEGVCSWYDFAYEIQESAQTGCIITPIESKNYPTKAKRPYYSVLNKSKIKHIFGIKIPHWKKSLRHCLQRL